MKQKIFPFPLENINFIFLSDWYGSVGVMGEFKKWFEEANKDPEYIALKILDEVAIIVKEYMEKNKISKKELTKKLNISVKKLNKILSGEYENLSIRDIVKIMKILGIKEIKIKID